jgi:hypothetical protein
MNTTTKGRPPTGNAKTAAQRVRESRLRRKTAGVEHETKLLLTREALNALRRLTQAQNATQGAVVSALLIQAETALIERLSADDCLRYYSLMGIDETAPTSNAVAVGLEATVDTQTAETAKPAYRQADFCEEADVGKVDAVDSTLPSQNKKPGRPTVSYEKNRDKWRVRESGGQRKRLGLFDTQAEGEAFADAYCIKAL